MLSELEIFGWLFKDINLRILLLLFRMAENFEVRDLQGS